jgi:DNA-binding NarL/FixJ family response regulator
MSFRATRLVVLTTYQCDVQALQALNAGAMGYLLKSMLRAELVDTIRTAHARKRLIPNEIAAELAEHVADDTLSEREIEVLRRVAMGASNKIITAQVGVSGDGPARQMMERAAHTADEVLLEGRERVRGLTLRPS